SKYERGLARPSIRIMSAIAEALQVKTISLLAEPACVVKFVSYRKGSGLTQTAQEEVESLVCTALEERIHLQAILQETWATSLPGPYSILRCEDAEAAASQLREAWKLGDDPIQSITDTLEEHGVHVLEVDASEKFDGVSARAFDVGGREIAAAVVSRRGAPGERQRLNLAHELGHLVLEIPAEVDEERATFRFGAAFLAPACAISRKAGSHRSQVSLDELLLLKKEFGLSIAALVMRLYQLGVITQTKQVSLFRQMKALRIWRHEPEEMTPEEPSWLRYMVCRAFSEKLITADAARDFLGFAPTDTPSFALSRQGLMPLSLADRRAVLAQQAAEMPPDYGQDPESRAFLGGDFSES
ncbi:MAG: ImmA/IrrE family metallo-endopeptidase, partial [bacterium]